LGLQKLINDKLGFTIMPAAGHKKIDETAAFPYVPRMNIFDQVSALWAAHQAVRMQPFGRGKSWIISLHLVLRDLCGEWTGERPSEGDGRLGETAVYFLIPNRLATTLSKIRAGR
jgi:hypothetical protein